MSLIFEWHEDKAARNFKKHKVSFEEAKTVFNDPFAVTIPDPVHSVDEDRYVNLGMSAAGQLLIVVYTEREDNIRLISCRKATPAERRNYEHRTF